MAYTQETVHEIVLNQRKFFRTGETLPVKWRIKQLKKLIEAGAYDELTALAKKYVEAIS